MSAAEVTGTSVLHLLVSTFRSPPWSDRTRRHGRMDAMTVIEIMLVARRHVDLARVCSCLESTV
ncbi:MULTISPECIES: hypothetical protein [unclassified Rhodococcus (in: high G+C Gram-positive bacteria)]|uniref:hypothetical protein n=1 Tax=unclassified Rhodococcus (in: high G+C Gram-positive bacteria) TaxID=192944 RepID=UPI0012E3BF0B|nr:MULTISPECIES: hypothetical protein [unclassified Rhodococcus (in: high G+C Gram-positive bacteria)]